MHRAMDLRACTHEVERGWLAASRLQSIRDLLRQPRELVVYGEQRAHVHRPVDARRVIQAV